MLDAFDARRVHMRCALLNVIQLFCLSCRGWLLFRAQLASCVMLSYEMCRSQCCSPYDCWNTWNAGVHECLLHCRELI